jgi:hypothetical protein
MAPPFYLLIVAWYPGFADGPMVRAVLLVVPLPVPVPVPPLAAPALTPNAVAMPVPFLVTPSLTTRGHGKGSLAILRVRDVLGHPSKPIRQSASHI